MCRQTLITYNHSDEGGYIFPHLFCAGKKLGAHFHLFFPLHLIKCG